MPKKIDPFAISYSAAELDGQIAERRAACAQLAGTAGTLAEKVLTLQAHCQKSRVNLEVKRQTAETEIHRVHELHQQRAAARLGALEASIAASERELEARTADLDRVKVELLAAQRALATAEQQRTAMLDALIDRKAA